MPTVEALVQSLQRTCPEWTTPNRTATKMARKGILALPNEILHNIFELVEAFPYNGPNHKHVPHARLKPLCSLALSCSRLSDIAMCYIYRTIILCSDDGIDIEGVFLFLRTLVERPARRKLVRRLENHYDLNTGLNTGPSLDSLLTQETPELVELYRPGFDYCNIALPWGESIMSWVSQHLQEVHESVKLMNWARLYLRPVMPRSVLLKDQRLLALMGHPDSPVVFGSIDYHFVELIGQRILAAIIYLVAGNGLKEIALKDPQLGSYVATDIPRTLRKRYYDSYPRYSKLGKMLGDLFGDLWVEKDNGPLSGLTQFTTLTLFPGHAETEESSRMCNDVHDSKWPDEVRRILCLRMQERWFLNRRPVTSNLKRHDELSQRLALQQSGTNVFWTPTLLKVTTVSNVDRW